MLKFNNKANKEEEKKQKGSLIKQPKNSKISRKTTMGLKAPTKLDSSPSEEKPKKLPKALERIKQSQASKTAYSSGRSGVNSATKKLQRPTSKLKRPTESKLATPSGKSALKAPSSGLKGPTKLSKPATKPAERPVTKQARVDKTVKKEIPKKGNFCEELKNRNLFFMNL